MYASSIAPVIEGVKHHYPVIVIGAGQAGLAMSYCLKTRGIDHLVLEASDKIGNAWRSQRWDSFCLVTPNWQCQLPGFAYPGDDPDGFMIKDQIIAYLDSYYRAFNPPVLFASPVTRLAQTRGRFVIDSAEHSFTCDQVVVACGSYHRPRIPPMAEAMGQVTHVHSSAYRNPAALPAGEVMVVGTGQSGCQIAEDLHLEGRKVHLCVGSAPRVNRRYRGKDVVKWLDEMDYYQTTIAEHPEGENAPHATNHYVTGRDGGRDLNLRLFAAQGMRLYGKLKSAADGVLTFADDLKQNLDYADGVAARVNESIEQYIREHHIQAPPDTNVHSDYLPETVTELDLRGTGITSVVWATGFAMDFSWVELPVFKDSGYPDTQRGQTAVPGLYFLGLNWMHTWGSGRFYHVGRDAEFLSDAIARHGLRARSA